MKTPVKILGISFGILCIISVWAGSDDKNLAFLQFMRFIGTWALVFLTAYLFYKSTNLIYNICEWVFKFLKNALSNFFKSGYETDLRPAKWVASDVTFKNGIGYYRIHWNGYEEPISHKEYIAWSWSDLFCRKKMVPIQLIEKTVKGEFDSYNEDFVNAELAQLKQLLLEKSVKHGDFLLSSGKRSDFYVDSKQTTLDPLGAKLVGIVGYALVQKVSQSRSVTIDAVGGLTMGADAISLAISMESLVDRRVKRLQSISVRKEPKSHGMNRLIEGDFKKGDRVVVVDDVITTGGSTLRAVQAIRDSGGIVEFVLVLVDREEDGWRAKIEAQNVEVHSLFRRSDFSVETPVSSSKVHEYSENASPPNELVPA